MKELPSYLAEEDESSNAARGPPRPKRVFPEDLADEPNQGDRERGGSFMHNDPSRGGGFRGGQERGQGRGRGGGAGYGGRGRRDAI